MPPSSTHQADQPDQARQPSAPRAPTGLIGVVHLPPLPGDPAFSGSCPGSAEARALPFLDAALRDAEALARGGADGLIVENFGSAPFAKGTIAHPAPPHHVAGIALAVHAVRSRFDLVVGVNCLRNDARAALGIARVTGAAFVRVNVLSGAYVTDQGIIEGEAHDVLAFRQRLGGTRIALCADVLVKHALPLVPVDPVIAASECAERGGADAIVLTGSTTGAPVDEHQLERVAAALPTHPLLIGSGLTAESAPALVPSAHGAIVGTWLKRGGDVRAPVDEERVRRLRSACAGRFRSL